MIADRHRPRSLGPDRAAFAALCVFLACTAPVAAARGPLPPAFAALPEHHLEARLSDLVDDARTREGLPPLAASETLALAARHHALEMIELGYVDHTSPTPGRRTPSERVARAGGTVVTIGENLAVADPSPDLAERVVAGWLGSPGHRANLLRADWTHVGHGVAEASDGRVAVVQVFALDPNPLLAVRAESGGAPRLRLELLLHVARGGVVVAGMGGRADVAVAASPSEEVRIALDGVRADERTFVQVGWAATRGEAAVVEVAGWLDPVAGTLELGPADPEAAVRLVEWTASPPAEPVQLELTFERDADDLVVLVGDAAGGTIVEGSTVRLAVPGDVTSEVAVGRPLGDGRLDVLHAFVVHPDAGGSRLVPAVR